MELPTVFDWGALLVVGMLVRSLSGMRHGWLVIAAAMALLAAGTLGYGAGMGTAREQAMRQAEAHLAGCDVVTLNDPPRTEIDVKACRESKSGLFRALLDIRMDFWISMAAAFVGVIALYYLVLRIHFLLTAVGQTGVARPEAADDGEQNRPKQRDGGSGESG